MVSHAACATPKLEPTQIVDLIAYEIDALGEIGNQLEIWVHQQTDVQPFLETHTGGFQLLLVTYKT